ncbi:MAG: hypothetical protein KF802_11440 [Bdellovibrionaceae bacterium]|nr:hypothetical protein [Pseudobdellovibrionaceae bacterium]MBX3032730.1 hypothetical protein [Pseudobdellovibrionaceae bacterium]
MKFQERSYSSTLFRPKPHIHLEGDGSLLLITTSWGEPEFAATAAGEIARYVTAARGDIEVTSPFEFLTGISDEANHLRIGLLLANDVLYRGENRIEYVSGVEVMAVSRTENEIAWAHVGAPHLLLRRPGRPLAPLATSFDHSFELALQGRREAPLPSRLLGVEPSCHVACGNLQIGSGDLLVLLASSHLPPALWTTNDSYDLPTITKQMIQADTESPFWLGLVDFEE